MRKKVKRKKKHHLNRLKTEKLVQAGSCWSISIFFLLIYFRFFNYYYYLCDQISFKHTSNNLKIYK